MKYFYIPNPYYDYYSPKRGHLLEEAASLSFVSASQWIWISSNYDVFDHMAITEKVLESS